VYYEHQQERMKLRMKVLGCSCDSEYWKGLEVNRRFSGICMFAFAVVGTRGPLGVLSFV